MTYNAGNLITATDYMSFRGVNAPSVSYTSDASATSKVAALIGVGYGQRGYGVTTTTLPAVISNTSIATATVWNNLRSAMVVLNTHTGSGLTLQPVVSTNDIIVANDGRSGLVNVDNLISTLDTNRFMVDAGQNVSTIMITNTTSSAWTNSIYHEFTVGFALEDRARYFFNSGGKIQLNASRTGGTVNDINTAVSNMFTTMGTVSIGATDTTYTGTGGTTSSIGYYGLTATFQNVFTMPGSGLFPDISYSVLARRENYVGQNGANGSLVRIRAFIDISNYISEIVDGTTESKITSFRTNGVVTVTNPSFTTTVGL
jgi:hypothetical protein